MIGRMNFRTRIFTVLVLVFTASIADAQPKAKPRRVTRPEVMWAVTHPFIAMKAMKLTRISLGISESLRADTTLDGQWIGGQLDAFRHSFWMAMLAQKIKPKKVTKLGNAHEKGNRLDFKKGRLEESAVPDSVNGAMDYFNNARGVQLGCENRKASLEELKEIIKKDILAGNMKIIATDKEGKFIDCGGKLIDMSYWSGKWEIPKCLVPSNKAKYKKPGIN
jgi:hypothetical protein